MRFTLTLRRKLVIAFAALAFIVAGLVGFIGYSVTEQGLRDEIDRSLTSAATTLSSGGTVAVNSDPQTGEHRDSGRDQGIIQAAQKIAPDGTVTVLVGSQLPLATNAASLATAAAGTFAFSNIENAGQYYRIVTQSLGSGNGVIQVARNLIEVDNVLDDLAGEMIWTGVGVLVIAAGLGWLTARQITRRLTALTAAAEQVSSTGHLDVGISTSGNDEVTRLGTAMQAMLAELSRARDDQQRLVQDAGHELRTPLTSLRTNVSVMRRYDELSPASRSRLLDDVEGEARELTNLVNELVELATDRRDAEEFEPLDLGELAEGVAQLFRRRTGREITIDATQSAKTVVARRHSVERAMSNLVDNALKFTPADAGPIEIDVHATTFAVADRGPGLTDEDAERIFNRFYRATTARSLPGSGLGLSIVSDIAHAHGGSVSAANRPGGGAVIGFTLDPATVLPNSKPNTASS